ncbi:MAG: hypothetical protein MUO62_03755, partial [Anaerolineales bacterium]|nr:hypothetical protein [Anaerolineales bacterium]
VAVVEPAVPPSGPVSPRLLLNTLLAAIVGLLFAVGIAFLVEHLDGLVERWELPAFNNLCRDKYRRLGMTWAYEDTPLLTQDELDQLEDWAKQSGFPPEQVMATGAVRVPDPNGRRR